MTNAVETETVLAAPAVIQPSHAVPTGMAFRYQLLALAFAIGGGFLGIGGALVEELRAGGFSVIAAGVIEEALKPAGIYILLAKWPFTVDDRRYTAALTAISGLTFGIIEACFYVFVYFPDAGDTFVLYRFTVPLVMHTLNSAIVGWGLDRDLIAWANGTGPFPRRTRNLFATAMAIHGGFNLVAVVLALTGVVSVS